MRMAKRFGLVLMVLALLVSFAGSATAGVTIDPAVSRSLDISIGYRSDSGYIASEILPVTEENELNRPRRSTFWISEDYRAYSDTNYSGGRGLSLYSVSVDVNISDDAFLLLGEEGRFGFAKNGKTLFTTNPIDQNGKSVDIFGDLVWDKTGVANMFTIVWDNGTQNKFTDSHFFIKLVGKRADLSDFVMTNPDEFSDYKYANSGIKVNNDNTALIDIPWNQVIKRGNYNEYNVYTDRVESNLVYESGKDESGTDKAHGARVEQTGDIDTATGAHQLKVFAEDGYTNSTYSVKFRDPYNTKDLGLFVISDGKVAGSPIPITVTGVDSATAHGKYVPDTVLKEVFFLPLSDDWRNADYATVIGVEHISNTETYRVHVEDEAGTVARTFILSFDDSTPPSPPSPPVPADNTDLNLFTLTIHALSVPFTANAAAGTATVTNWGTNGVLNPIPPAADVAFAPKAGTKATVGAVTAGTTADTLSVTVTAEDGTTTKTYTISFTPTPINPPDVPTGGGSSGGGCDAGLGAFGLIILAGSAMVLRRKK